MNKWQGVYRKLKISYNKLDKTPPENYHADFSLMNYPPRIRVCVVRKYINCDRRRRSNFHDAIMIIDKMTDDEKILVGDWVVKVMESIGDDMKIWRSHREARHCELVYYMKPIVR